MVKIDLEFLKDHPQVVEIWNNVFMGTFIHNIELYPGQGGIISRSAGSYAQLSAREGKYAIIKMPSIFLFKTYFSTSEYDLHKSLPLRL